MNTKKCRRISKIQTNESTKRSNLWCRGIAYWNSSLDGGSEGLKGPSRVLFSSVLRRQSEHESINDRLPGRLHKRPPPPKIEPMVDFRYLKNSSGKPCWAGRALRTARCCSGVEIGGGFQGFARIGPARDFCLRRNWVVPDTGRREEEELAGVVAR